MKQFIKRSVLIWAAAILLTGCTAEKEEIIVPEGREDIILTVCMPVAEWRESIDGLTKLYLEEHPEITDIEWELVDGSMYVDLLGVKLASQSLPDIMCTGFGCSLMEWTPHLEPLDDLAAADELPEYFNQAGFYEGVQYAVPALVHGQGILYNESLLAQAGWDSIPETKSDFYQLCADLKAHEVKPVINHYKETILTMTNHFAVMSILSKEDPRSYISQLAADGISEYSQDRDWEALADFFDTTLMFGNQNSLTTSAATARNYFLIEKYAMITEEGVFTVPAIRSVNPELEGRIRLGIVPLFEEPEENKMPVEVISLAVTKNSRYQEQAQAFIDWFISDDAALAYQREVLGCLPAMSLGTDGTADLSPLAADLKELIISGKTAYAAEYDLPMDLRSRLAESWVSYLTGQKERDEVFQDYRLIWKEHSSNDD